MEEIKLYDLLRFYAKNWYNIITVALIGAIIGVVYTFYIQTPLYESKATLLAVGTQRTGGSQDSVTLNNYVSLFTSHRVLDEVIDKQKYDKGYDQLASNTTAQNDKNTDILRVSIATPDAQKSKSLLESAIASFRTQAKDLYGNGTLDIKVVDAANVPTESSNVKPVTQIGLATVGGFIFAIIALFFIYDYRKSQEYDKEPARSKNEAELPGSQPVPLNAPVPFSPVSSEYQPEQLTPQAPVQTINTPTNEETPRATTRQRAIIASVLSLLIGTTETDRSNNR